LTIFITNETLEKADFIECCRLMKMIIEGTAVWQGSMRSKKEESLTEAWWLK
jgi:hypothetical protein